MEGQPGVVISSGELGYLRRLAKGERGAASLQDSKKARRKQLSEARYKNWPDTLEAVRAKKERARQERLEAAEARARAIDEEEAAYQKGQRRRAIDRANRLLYEDSEPVRRLRGSLLLAQVSKEREVQIERHKRQQSVRKRQQAIYEQQVRDAAEKMRVREENEAKERQRLEIDARTGQEEQRRLVEARKRAEVKADRAEGQRLREEAAARERDEVAKAKAEVERKKKATAEFLAFNRKLEEQRDAQRRAEEEEERRLAEFAAAKEQQYYEKRQHEAELFKQRMRTRGQLIEQEMERTKKRLEQEEGTLQKNLADIEQRRREREEGDHKRNKMLVDEALQDWDAQRDRKRAAKERQTREEHELAERWAARTKQKEADERAERDRKRLEAKELEEFLRLQMKTKAREDAERERLESKVSASALSSNAPAERFREYTDSILREAGVAPEDAKPVDLMLSKLKHEGAI